MFRGEYESLKAIQVTNTVKTPKPIIFGKTGDGQNFIVMSHIKNMTKLSEKNWAKLGSQLADLHLYNTLHNTSLVFMWFV